MSNQLELNFNYLTKEIFMAIKRKNLISCVSFNARNRIELFIYKDFLTSVRNSNDTFICSLNRKLRY